MVLHEMGSLCCGGISPWIRDTKGPGVELPQRCFDPCTFHTYRVSRALEIPVHIQRTPPGVD